MDNHCRIDSENPPSTLTEWRLDHSLPLRWSGGDDHDRLSRMIITVDYHASSRMTTVDYHGWSSSSESVISDRPPVMLIQMDDLHYSTSNEVTMDDFLRWVNCRFFGGWMITSSERRVPRMDIYGRDDEKVQIHRNGQLTGRFRFTRWMTTWNGQLTGRFRFTRWMTTWKGQIHGMDNSLGWTTTRKVQIHGMNNNLEGSDSPDGWLLGMNNHLERTTHRKVRIHRMDDNLEWTTHPDGWQSRRFGFTRWMTI